MLLLAASAVGARRDAARAAAPDARRSRGRPAAARAGEAHRIALRPTTVFWIIGLGSPVFLYALDLWEHTLGLACMAWARRAPARLLVTVRRRQAAVWLERGRCGRVVRSGCDDANRGVALRRGRHRRDRGGDRRSPPVHSAARGPVGLGALAGIVPVLVANDLLEKAVLGGSLRSSRAAGTAGAAGSEVATRLGEALRTTIGLNYASLSVEALAGGCSRSRWSRRR